MIIGNPIMAGVSGPAASIFVTGLSETDTVTATNGSKTLTGKLTQNPNPVLHGLPNGYTELAYIECTGSQYINPNVVVSKNIEIYLHLYQTSLFNGNVFFGTNVNAGWSWTGNILCFGHDAGGLLFGASSYRGVNCGNEVKGLFTCYGTDLEIPSSSDSFEFNPGSLNLLLLYAQGSYGKSKVYSYKISKGGTLVRNLVPAKRNSDGSIGMYDLITNAFFGNAGTGKFIAGAKVPQTINGFLIKPIRDFGTWTVTATNGTKTATQDVLVDVITDYKIKMSL